MLLFENSSMRRNLLTTVIHPPEIANSGAKARMTKVSFHPYMKPIIIPAIKQKNHWKKFPILSPIPSVTLFTSLKSIIHKSKSVHKYTKF